MAQEWLKWFMVVVARMSFRSEGKLRGLHEVDQGYRSPESEWPEIQQEMVSAMSRLETAIEPVLDSLTL